MFQTDNTALTGTYDGATVPQDVAVVCQWTGMCTDGDIHANDLGHQQLAAAFEQVIDNVTVKYGRPAGGLGHGPTTRAR